MNTPNLQEFFAWTRQVNWLNIYTRADGKEKQYLLPNGTTVTVIITEKTIELTNGCVVGLKNK